MIFIFGIHFFTWGSERTQEAMHCQNCGTIAPFLVKKGMRFITFFFIIPVIPISGISTILECPNCKTRYQQSVAE